MHYYYCFWSNINKYNVCILHSLVLFKLFLIHPFNKNVFFFFFFALHHPALCRTFNMTCTTQSAEDRANSIQYVSVHFISGWLVSFQPSSAALSSLFRLFMYLTPFLVCLRRFSVFFSSFLLFFIFSFLLHAQAASLYIFILFTVLSLFL